MNANQTFDVQAVATGAATALTVTQGGTVRAYDIPGGEHQDYLDFFRALAGDFGTRSPHAYEGPAGSDGVAPDWRPLILENLSPRILAGYGDPAVLKTDEGYIVVATSNDAPDAFPIL